MKFAAALLLGAVLVAQKPTAEDVRTKLNAYLTEYEPKLSELIADEVMTQENRRQSRYAAIGNEPTEVRTLSSEVAFIALPGEAGWMGFRRVMRVGAKSVDDALGALNTVLINGGADDYSRARLMLNDSARFNLGTPRTINLPNLPLELLHPRHTRRFSTRIAGEETVRGHKTIRLVLVENAVPTIIRTADNKQMRSIVSAFVDAATGQLWRADVIARDPRETQWVFDHVVSVEFREEATLGLLVPGKMHEDFFVGKNRKGFGDATYSNYRRFTTSARIVP